MKKLHSIMFIVALVHLGVFFPAEAQEKEMITGKLKSKYVRTVLCEISKSDMAKMREEDGVHSFQILEDLKHDDEVVFGVDAKDCIYVLFKTTVRIFDKNCKLIQKVHLDPKNANDGNYLLVDKNGDFCVGGKIGLNYVAYIYRKNADYKNPIRVDSLLPGPIFSNGILYSKFDGKIFFSFDEKKIPKEKIFLNSFFDGNTKNHGIGIYKKELGEESILPKKIDGYELVSIIALDDDENLYICGSKPVSFDSEPDGFGNEVMLSDFRIYKFGPRDHLIDFIHLPFPNPGEGDVVLENGDYNEVEINDLGYRFVRWSTSGK